MKLDDETLEPLARLLIASDDTLRDTLAKARLKVDGDEEQIRRDNFIQILRSFLSERIT